MSGASERRAVAVQIAGHEYKIRSDGDEEGLVRIAGYVDQAMQRVRERTGTVDSLDVAVLTCLNLAREILSIHGAIHRAIHGAMHGAMHGAIPGANHGQRSGAIQDERLRSLIERVESAAGGRDRLDRPDSAESAQSGGSAGESVVVDSAQRTLELPSVETLRDRIPAETREHAPQVRIAAGGRDRVG